MTSLRRADVNWDKETRKDFYTQIDVEADRLAELVESLCTSIIPDRGCAKPANDMALTHPITAVAGALHRVRGFLGDRPLRLEVSPNLPAMRMDTSQMERVLANLIQNAIKYSPPGTAIGIAARLSATNELELSVEDEGPGILAENLERIFEPFFRQQAAQQSKVPGHGLGLAISQSIVMAHGGRIQVSNQPGAGARFSVFLPLPARSRSQKFDNRYEQKERGNDAAKHSRGGRRGTDAQAPRQQSQGQRLRRSVGSRWHGSVETHRAALVRPVAA